MTFIFLFIRLSITTLFIALISGCDNGVPITAARVSNMQTRLSGHALNDDGPINQGRVEAKDTQGHIAAQTELKGQSVYELTLPTGTIYPLVLAVYPEATPNDTLKAVVTDPSVSMQDISPVTTIVVNTALSLGGFTETNLAKAAGAAIAQRKKSGGGGGGGAATTSESFKGDSAKQYGGWH
jgi:hypothetical protein